MSFSISSLKTSFSKMFHSAPKKAAEEGPKRPVHKTKIKTDVETGETSYERVYTDVNGRSLLFRTETKKLADGKDYTRTKVQALQDDGSVYTYGDEAVVADREKTLTREKGGSILGGDKVTIEKEWHETMGSTQHKDKLVKEFNEKGQLEHKDYTLKYRHWDRAKHGTQDRAYEEFPLNHSTADITEVNPNLHTDYKHSYNGNNNYFHFKDGGESKYTRAVKAQEQAKADAAKAAEEAAIAAEKAKAEYEATLPVINTGKMFGKDISAFERTEKTLENGTIERVYTEKGKDTPSIRTRDNGKLHEEWVTGGKAEMIYFRQYDNQVPYIVSKKDGYTQVYSKTGDYGAIENQYRFDGIRSYHGNKYGATMTMPYKETQAYKTAEKSTQEMYDRNAQPPYGTGKWFQRTSDSKAQSPEIHEEYENAKNSFLDLKGLFEAYKE